MTVEDQRKELETIDSSMLNKKEKVERIHVLPDLPGATDGNVVMRFAPGPSGPLHLGHTRVAILNDEYCKRYNGVFVNRIEDTNPEKIDPDAYKMIPEDLEWMGSRSARPSSSPTGSTSTTISPRQLIEKDAAYVCTCPADDWRKMKEEGRSCPHRDLPKETQLEMFEKMLAGHFEEEKAILVVKTDLKHPNPAVRDFVGLRIVKQAHPRVGTRYCVYPAMNFSVAVDDHFLGMTHVIRGIDHLNNTLRQEYIFNYFGWKMPWYHHYGLVSIPEAILKTSTVGKGIKTGEYSGWDDVRLGTVRAMEKRGISPDAIRQFWVDCGIKDANIEFSWENLYAYNRDIVQNEADRYFFVWNPTSLKITGMDKLESHAPLHPDHPEKGVRKYIMAGDPIEVRVVSRGPGQRPGAGQAEAQGPGQRRTDRTELGKVHRQRPGDPEGKGQDHPLGAGRLDAGDGLHARRDDQGGVCREDPRVRGEQGGPVRTVRVRPHRFGHPRRSRPTTPIP